METCFWTCALLALSAASPPNAPAASAAALQTGALDVGDFEGSETWPLREAGELALDTSALRDLRAEYDFRSSPPGAERTTTTMSIDVRQVFLRGLPALWIEWLSTGTPGDPEGTAVLDAILVDRESFRPALRIAGGAGAGDWVGPYDVTLHRPERVVQVRIDDGGGVEHRSLEESTLPVEFATYPFLLPFLELEEGLELRLLNAGGWNDLSPRAVSVRVVGRTTYVDAVGDAHATWKIRLLTANRGALVTFWVTEQPPFYLGWHYRLVRDGATLVEMDYRHHRML